MGMGKNKPATLLLILVLTLPSLIAIKSLPVSAISKPAVPEEISMSFSAHPYDVPPVTSIDPYTGKNITTQAGHRVENKTIDFTVKNQPYTSYTDTQGHKIGLYYQVSYKGHYEESWSTPGKPFAASSGEYSVIAISYDILNGLSPEGKMDFRIRAGIGYVTSWQYSMDIYVYELNGEKSGWSSIQTITIGENGSAAIPTTETPTFPSPQSTSTPAPTVTPTPVQSATTPIATQPIAQTGVIFGLDWQQIALIVLAVIVTGLLVVIVGLLFYFKRQKWKGEIHA